MNKSARDHFCILPTPLLIVTLVIALSACTSDPSADSPAAVTDAINRPGNPDAYDVVDCLLPGQIRQLGTMTTYVTERRPVRTTKEDCHPRW